MMSQQIFVITGAQGSGKTSFLKKIVQGFRQDDIKVGGLLAKGTWKDNQRDQFFLINLDSNEHMIFCQRDPINDWEKIRHFYINPFGQQFGEKALAIDQLKTKEIVIIDEIGPFELAGKGWAQMFENILSELTIPMIISVRKSLIDQVIERWNLQVEKIIDINDATEEDGLLDLRSYFVKS